MYSNIMLYEYNTKRDLVKKYLTNLLKVLYVFLNVHN